MSSLVTRPLTKCSPSGWSELLWVVRRGATALMEAAQFGSLDCLNILLKHGANVELEELAADGGGTGWTAM